MNEKRTLQVEGMTCGHCVKAVEENVNRIPGVKTAVVNLDASNVNVEYDASIVGLKKITATIEDQGFDVTN